MCLTSNLPESQKAQIKKKAENQEEFYVKLFVTFQKMLDKDSVVRESEYARSGAGQSLKNQLAGFFEKKAVGGAGGPPSRVPTCGLFFCQSPRVAHPRQAHAEAG